MPEAAPLLTRKGGAPRPAAPQGLPEAEMGQRESSQDNNHQGSEHSTQVQIQEVILTLKEKKKSVIWLLGRVPRPGLTASLAVAKRLSRTSCTCQTSSSCRRRTPGHRFPCLAVISAGSQRPAKTAPPNGAAPGNTPAWKPPAHLEPKADQTPGSNCQGIGRTAGEGAYYQGHKDGVCKAGAPDPRREAPLQPQDGRGDRGANAERSGPERRQLNTADPAAS